MTTRYEVIVGNIGSVYSDAYVITSRNLPNSRCGGESVIMFENGEIVQEHEEQSNE